YFGDKASPLSDTVNLAAASAGSDVFAHIRESLLTSVPSLLLALLLFAMLGRPGTFDATATLAGLERNFVVSPWAFLPLAFIVALAFGAVVEHAGLLDRLIEPVRRKAQSGGALVAAVVGTCVAANLVTSDQYIAIVLPGRMFRAEFVRRGLAPVVLSRAVGDSATVTSPLIPWNSCGAYMAATLGVPRSEEHTSELQSRGHL